VTTQAPPQHVYGPAGSAREVFGCRAAEVLLSGAAGTGKSRACLEKLHAMALLNPSMRGLICRKTATSLGSTALVTWREIVAKEALDSGEMRFYGGSPQEAACYKYANASVIVIGGMDKATRIMSSEYDACYVQEATELTEDDWEMITTRLRNGKVSFQQLMADCNPGPPQHWLNQRCERGQSQMILCRHEDNPRLFADGEWTTEGLSYIARLEALTGVRYLRLRKGIWAAAEGLVYEGWNPDVHLHPPIGHPPDDWPRYLSVDFGYRNPFTAQWWAQDHDERLYLYKEIYMSGRLVEDHARQIRANMKTKHGPEPEFTAVICDTDAEDRGTLERHLGISTVAAHKTVSEGIQAVAERLRVREDGKPGLYICRDALIERDPVLADAHRPMCAEQEILEYIWDPAQFQSHSVVRSGTTQREMPLKQNDHGMDAMRYLVANVDLQKRPGVRFM
jgi:PBSX family phage terminase large subunit